MFAGRKGLSSNTSFFIFGELMNGIAWAAEFATEPRCFLLKIARQTLNPTDIEKDVVHVR
jgi:hypothetical protein